MCDIEFVRPRRDFYESSNCTGDRDKVASIHIDLSKQLNEDDAIIRQGFKFELGTVLENAKHGEPSLAFAGAKDRVVYESAKQLARDPR